VKKTNNTAAAADVLATLDRPRRSADNVTTRGKHKKVQHLAIARQSSPRALEDDNELNEFDKTAQMTLDRSDTRDLPGAQSIRAIASDLVRQNARGAQLREQMNFVPLIDPNNPRAVVGYFSMVDGEDGTGAPLTVGYILAVYSAAKTTMKVGDDDLVSIDNAFSNAVAQIVHRHKVRNIHIGPFHRLVRHKKAAEQLETNLIENRTVIHCDTGPIDLGTEAGRDTYTLNALIGEKQYVGTVQSLTNGAHALAEFGKWPKADSQLPAAGYKFRSDTDTTPVPDLDALPMVRDLITWAADANVSNGEIAERLAAKYSYGSGVAKSRSGDATTIADLRHPETAVVNLLRRGLPLWLNGAYEYEIAIPHHLATEKLRTIAKEQVRIAEDGENRGARRVSYRIDFHHEELPGGEWIDRETIEQALVVRFAPRARKATGRAASRGQRKPLAGIGEWKVDGEQWAVSARHSANYLVKARPLGDAKNAEGNRLGWLDGERDIRAVLNPAEVHRAIADAAISHLDRVDALSWTRSGIAVTLTGADDAAAIPQLVANVEKAEKRIADLEFDYEIARADRLVETARARLRDLEDTRRELKELQDRIAAAQNALGERRLLDAEANGNAHNLAATFAALHGVELDAPAALNDLLRHTLSDLRATIIEDGLAVELSFGVRVSSTDGPIVLAPVTARVANRARKVSEVRHEALVAAVFRDGMTLDDAAAAHGYTVVGNAARRLHKELAELIPNSELRAAALVCPVAETKLVIWYAYEANREGKAFRVPVGIDPAFAQHVLDVYGDANRGWVRAWASGSHVTARAAVEAVKISGEAGMKWDDLLDILEPGSTAARRRLVSDELTNGKGSSFGNDHTIVFDRVLDRSEKWHGRNGDRRVWVRECPYCGERTLSHVLRVPEVPGGLVCGTCRHTPSLPTVTFPEAYLTEWAGHRGH
jgi:hypothetical protein